MNLATALEFIREFGRPFYVYVLRRPSGEPFYVGKGSGDRLTKHEWEAARTHLDNFRLRVIRSAGVQYEIAGTFSDEAGAFAEERRLIELYGRLDRKRGPLCNHTDGGEGASNPSDETLAKRIVKLRAVMSDPAKKAAAVAVLLQHRDLRNERAIAALRTPELRAKRRVQMLEKWKDPVFRLATTKASALAQTDEWRQSLREGQARKSEQSKLNRLTAWLAPEVQAKMRQSANMPHAKADASARAKTQRAIQTEARRRVLVMATRLQAEVEMPDWRSGLQTWLDLEVRLGAAGVL